MTTLRAYLALSSLYVVRFSYESIRVAFDEEKQQKQCNLETHGFRHIKRLFCMCVLRCCYLLAITVAACINTVNTVCADKYIINACALKLLNKLTKGYS